MLAVIEHLGSEEVLAWAELLMSVWEGVRFGLWTGFVIRGGCGVGQVSGGQVEPEDFVSVEP